jgi:type VI secretion system protein ImpJ
MTQAIPDLIQWHEGLLLSPQHFQQLSLRLESLIQAVPGRYFPYFWGVRAFEYDASEFTAGVLNVRVLDAVMPDGFHVIFAPERDELQVDLRPFAGQMRGKPLLVHLAMPAGEGHAPVAMNRFSSYEGDPVPDENTGDGAMSIPRLRPRLSLIPSAEKPSTRYTSFPLIEVRCEGETFLPTDYVPPTLGISASSPIGKRCHEVSEQLRSKAAQLAERAMLTPQSRFAVEIRSQLRALVTALPAFEAILRTDSAHPFMLYLELCRVAGSVAILGHSLLPPLFPQYQHNDLHRNIEQVVRYILQSVKEGVPDVLRRYSFEQEEEGFTLAADPAWSDAFAAQSGARLVLAVKSEAGEAKAVEWGENAVIGGRDAIGSLLSRRVLGLRRQAASRVGDFVAPLGLFLFELTADAEDMRPGDDLLVLGSIAGVRPEALYLSVLEPDAARGVAKVDE